MQTRRSILCTLGCAVTVPTAGCAGIPVEYLDSKTKLFRLDLTDLSSSSHRFGIRVKRNDTVVHESTHTLEGDGESVFGTVGACPWMDTPGSYIVAARLGDGEWKSQSVDEGVRGNPEYVVAHIIYDGWNKNQLTFVIRPADERDTSSAERCHLAPSPRDE